MTPSPVKVTSPTVMVRAQHGDSWGLVGTVGDLSGRPGPGADAIGKRPGGAELDHRGGRPAPVRLTDPTCLRAILVPRAGRREEAAMPIETALGIGRDVRR